MGNFEMPGGGDPASCTRVVTCDLALLVREPAQVVVQVAAAHSAGAVLDERFEVSMAGGCPPSVVALAGPHGSRLHVLGCGPGRVTVEYRAELETHGRPPPTRVAGEALAPGAGGSPGGGPPFAGWHSPGYDRLLYLRPSRYCPSDHLVGFAVGEFGAGGDAGARVAAIVDWIRRRVGYVPGSGSVHDSAEETLFTGVGSCRDFAHLGVALCRATGIPARFTAVYAPGLSPMDFHAVFEALQDGRWCVHDPTGLAPRSSMVRIGTGRDAADTAFVTVTSGIADLELLEVSATVGLELPGDDHSGAVELD